MVHIGPGWYEPHNSFPQVLLNTVQWQREEIVGFLEEWEEGTSCEEHWSTKGRLSKEPRRERSTGDENSFIHSSNKTQVIIGCLLSLKKLYWDEFKVCYLFVRKNIHS